MKAFLKRLRESGVHMEFGRGRVCDTDGINIRFYGYLQDDSRFTCDHVISCEILNDDFEMSIPGMLNILLDDFLKSLEKEREKEKKAIWR